MINHELSPESIKYELVQLLDRLVSVQNQKQWEELATPELESDYQQAIEYLDKVWFGWRSLIGSQID